MITGLGQYPNLGVTDAFITVSIGDEQYTVRASRELGTDRLDTAVGPLPIEVLEGPEDGSGSRASPTSGASTADLTFTGTVDALEEPRTFIRSTGGSAGREPLRPGRRVGGRPERRRSHLRGHARPLEGRPRPVVGRAARRRAGASRHPGPAGQDGYGFRHDWIPMQFDDHMIKVQVDQDGDGHRHVEESMRVWNSDLGQAGRAPRTPRDRHRPTAPAPAR